MVKNLPAHAKRRGFNYLSEKMSHTGEQLSPCVTTIEPVL